MKCKTETEEIIKTSLELISSVRVNWASAWVELQTQLESFNILQFNSPTPESTPILMLLGFLSKYVLILSLFCILSTLTLFARPSIHPIASNTYSVHMLGFWFQFTPYLFFSYNLIVYPLQPRSRILGYVKYI